MGYDPTRDKVLKTWRIQITDNQVAVISLMVYNGGDPRLQTGPAEMERDRKVVYGRIRRWGLSELLRFQEMADRAVEEMLSRQTGGAVKVPVGSWILYRNLQRTLLRRLKKENPKGYRLVIAHISEKVEKRGEGRGLRIRIDGLLSEILQKGNLAS